VAPNRLRGTAAACALALICGLGLTACDTDEPGVDEPAREGLAIDVAGIDYNVFLTRELNLAIPPDKAYYDRPAPPGSALFGVFIQACNPGDDLRRTTDEFKVEDNQGNEFEPIELPERNAFAYHSRLLGKEDCIPESGSVAQLGPTAGSMLLFQFPLRNTENRPLELIIGTEPESKTVELDL
jgi:hypothetical protein